MSEDRKHRMAKLKAIGFSYGEIGNMFGISRQRVHAILSGYQYLNKNKNFKGISKMVFLRDNNRCSICGSKENLIIHHIDGDDANNKLGNLLTLCTECHLAHHRPQNGDTRQRFNKAIEDGTFLQVLRENKPD